jgi:ketopantoate reductase
MRTDPPCLQEPFLLQSIWSKITISTGVNTTNLLTGGFCDDLIQDNRMAALVHNLFQEIIDVAKAVGTELPFTADEQLQFCKDRSPKCKFSMLQVQLAATSQLVKLQPD